LVLLVLPVEHGPTGQAHNSNFKSFCFEFGRGFESYRHFTPTADDGQVFAFHIVKDIATAGSAFNGGAFEIRKVLTRERNDGGGFIASKRNEIRS